MDADPPNRVCSVVGARPPVGACRPPRAGRAGHRDAGRLAARQLAREEQKTFTDQQEAATKREASNEQTALAEQQTGITRSEPSIRVTENGGAAGTARKQGRGRHPRDGEGGGRGRGGGFRGQGPGGSFGGTENLPRQAALTALVEIAKDSKAPLVPSVVLGGDGPEVGGMAGLPGFLLALAAEDLAPNAALAPDGQGRR